MDGEVKVPKTPPALQRAISGACGQLITVIETAVALGADRREVVTVVLGAVATSCHEIFDADGFASEARRVILLVQESAPVADQVLASLIGRKPEKAS